MTKGSAPDVFDRIADIFDSEHPPAEIGGVITATEAALAGSKQAAAAAREMALNPRTKPAEVGAARAAMGEEEFRRARLEAALGQLREERDRVTKLIADREHQARYEEIKAERDVLAADLAKRYPKLAAEMAALIERVRASDAQIEALRGLGGERLKSAEQVARNDTLLSAVRLAEARIPDFTPRFDGWLWPKPQS